MNYKTTVMEVLRLKKGWTQTKLAAAVDRSQGEISNYETGSNVPSDETLQRIANVLKVEDPTILLKEWKPEYENTIIRPREEDGVLHSKHI